jgi:hypothetical protein
MEAAQFESTKTNSSQQITSQQNKALENRARIHNPMYINHVYPL